MRNEISRGQTERKGRTTHTWQRTCDECAAVDNGVTGEGLDRVERVRRGKTDAWTTEGISEKSRRHTVYSQEERRSYAGE